MFPPDPKPALHHAPADVYGCGIGITHSLLSLVVPLLPSLCLCVSVEWEINYNTISTSLSCTPTESASDCCCEPDSNASVGGRRASASLYDVNLGRALPTPTVR